MRKLVPKLLLGSMAGPALAFPPPFPPAWLQPWGGPMKVVSRILAVLEVCPTDFLITPALPDRAPVRRPSTPASRVTRSVVPDNSDSDVAMPSTSYQRYPGGSSSEQDGPSTSQTPRGRALRPARRQRAVGAKYRPTPTLGGFGMDKDEGALAGF